LQPRDGCTILAGMNGAANAALVTGAGRRIGRAIAIELGNHGWSVAVHYNRSEHDALAVVREIQSKGGAAVAVRADLALESETSGLIDRAVEALGPLGALVNNASVFEPDSTETASRASWDAHMEVNLRAPFVLSQGFARQLPPAARGCIINVLDQKVLNLNPHFISYTVSKSALWTLTRAMALAFAPRVRVNGVGPGPTLLSSHQTEEEFTRLAQRLPLGRGATPQEIAGAVRFLLEAPSITGQMLAVDGGEHLGWEQPRAEPV
jgi:NAD(P)-dependent dehydrogenase (short-subunit alcohol dehydrogenase family)